MKSQTTNNAVYGEFARFPMCVSRNIRILKYWFKIMKNPDSLLAKVFQSELNDQGEPIGKDSWSFKVKELIQNLGFNYLWNDSTVSNLQLGKMI